VRVPTTGGPAFACPSGGGVCVKVGGRCVRAGWGNKPPTSVLPPTVRQVAAARRVEGGGAGSGEVWQWENAGCKAWGR